MSIKTMLQKTILFSFLFILFFNTKAQVPFLHWAKGAGSSSNDGGRAIAVDKTGNIYTTGHFEDIADFDSGPGTYTLSSNGVFDVFISKTDPNGNLLWVKQIGGNNVDEGMAICIDKKNNILVTGIFSGTCDFDPGAGTFNLSAVSSSPDIFILKLNSSGDFLWANAMGGSLWDTPYSIVTDSTGHVYSSGTFQNTVDFDPGAGVYNLTSAGQDDIYISKLDSSGNFIFTKSFGGTWIEYNPMMVLDASENLYVTGMFQDTVDFDPGPATLNLITAGNYDGFILKMDPNGNLNWAKRFGGTNWDQARSIAMSPAGNVYLAGAFMGTSDLDPGSGVTTMTAIGNEHNIFVSRLTPAGDLVWAKQMPATITNNEPSIALGIAVDANETVYTTGLFRDTVDFDPGPGVFNLVSSGQSDIFLSILSSSGNYLWAGKMGSSMDDMAYSICVDNSNNVYSTGFFSQTVDFDPFNPVYNLVSNGYLDIYIHKMNTTAVGIAETTKNDLAALYPNPSNGLMTVQLAHQSTIHITNALGQEISSIDLNSGAQAIDLRDQPCGIYFLRIVSPDKPAVTKKIITQ